jgi:hypothetical protein
MATVSTFPQPTIPLDANGVPVRHTYASFKCRQEASDFLNELPTDNFIHLCPDDVELLVARVIERYLHEVRR